MKILWHSVYPAAPTGYGQQTGLVCRALRDAGHEVAISCTFGIGAHTTEWNGIKCLPPGKTGAMGNDVVKLHADYFKPDLIWSFLDTFVLDATVVGELPWAAWVMADTDPIMSLNKPVLDACRWPVAESQFGVRALKEAGYDPLYVPHMIDPDVFYPGDKEAAREQLSRLWKRHIGDAFMVCVNSANNAMPGRKNIPAIIEAWGQFQPQLRNALLYLHMEASGTFSNGHNILALCEQYGVDMGTVVMAPQYAYLTGQLPQDYLRAVYQASDAYLNPSFGEGFGIPTIEAQACGCPVLVTKATASPELVFGGETMTGVWIHTSPGCRQMYVPANVIYSCLRAWTGEMCTGLDEADRAEMSKRAVEGAKAYHEEAVMRNHMLPALARIEAQLNRG